MLVVDKLSGHPPRTRPAQSFGVEIPACDLPLPRSLPSEALCVNVLRLNAEVKCEIRNSSFLP